MKFYRFEIYSIKKRDWYGLYSSGYYDRPSSIAYWIDAISYSHESAGLDGLEKYKHDSNWRFAFTPIALLKMEHHFSKLLEEGGDRIRMRVIENPLEIALGKSNLQIAYKENYDKI